MTVQKEGGEWKRDDSCDSKNRGRCHQEDFSWYLPREKN